MRQLRWISVEDRLPPDDVWVLAARKEGMFTELAVFNRAALDGETGRRNDIWFTSCDSQPETRITHWMELPEPPKK